MLSHRIRVPLFPPTPARGHTATHSIFQANRTEWSLLAAVHVSILPIAKELSLVTIDRMNCTSTA